MKLLVGLGNPGAKYANTRHNIGFMAIDALADANNFPPFRKKFQGELSEGRIGTEKVILLKPQTFMNLSGQSVGEALRFYKLDTDDIIVLHDELDIAPTKCRVKTGGGHAGHNGLRSLHQHIGPDYHRVRLGIGHPGDKNKVANYVLHEFAKADHDWLDDLMRGISDGGAALVTNDFAGFQNKVALRVNPPKAKPAPKPKPMENKPNKPASTENSGPMAALKALLKKD